MDNRARALLNSFQEWAIDYAALCGFQARPLGNWIAIGSDAIMTAQGLRAFCQDARQC